MDRKQNFSYDGLNALYDYFWEYEEEVWEKIELDVIGICCEYDEYETAIECASNYFDFEGMTYWDEWKELESLDRVEQKALEYLENRTQVITFETWIIIQSF